MLPLFCVLAFWLLSMRELSSLTRDDTHPPALEGEIITSGPPEESPTYPLKRWLLGFLWCKITRGAWKALP